MVYRMIFNQEAYFGRGAIKQIPDVAKAHGFTKAFIVTDPVLIETGTVKKVTDVLDEAGMPYEVFSNVQPNPPVECIKDGVAKFADAGADFALAGGRGRHQEPVRADLRRADHRRHRLGDHHQLRDHRYGEQAQVRGRRPA